MATGYHSFDEYSQGDANWDYNQEFNIIDDLLWKVGVEADRDADPPDGSLFLNLTDKTIEQYDSNTGNWEIAAGRLTTEQVEDIVGGMVTAAFDYSDPGGTLDLADGGVSNAKLANSALTVAGNSVSLGGAVAIAHADLSAISADDHHTRYADEEAQDAVGSILSARFAYDDAGNSIDLATGEVTNTYLANDSVTYTAGNGLTGGGAVPLGGSASVDIAAGGVGLAELATTFALSDVITAPFDVNNNSIVDNDTPITIYDAGAGPGGPGAIVCRIESPYVEGDLFQLPDTATEPSSNGEIRRDAGDVLIYSGGAVRNVSNLGSSGGAPTDASYVTTENETSLSNETVINYPLQLADLATPFALPNLTDLNLSGNDLVDSAKVIWDTSASAVPQGSQGGPAGELSTYPLASADLATGSVTTNEIENGTILEEDLSPTVAIGGFRQVNATSDYTAQAQDSVWVDASTSGVTITLPSPTQSAQVRVVVTDETNPVTLSDNAGEGIDIGGESTSSISMSDDEVIVVESDGTSWEVVARIEQYLDSGILGTLSAADDTLDTTISAVVSDVTTPIADVVVYPADGQALSGEYAFSADFGQVRDYTNSETDVFVRVEWDSDTRPSDIDLVYEVHTDSNAAVGAGAGEISIQDSGTDEGVADTINFDSNLSASVTGGVATVSSSGGSGGGLTDGAEVTSLDSPFAAAEDTHYPVNTNDGAVEVDLPGTPTDRARVMLTVVLGGNDLTVDGNGNDIESQLNDTITSQYTTAVYEYFAATGEWVEVT